MPAIPPAPNETPGADPKGKSLQEIMSGELFASSKGELVETLRFMEGHGTPLSDMQLQNIALLRMIENKRGHKAFEPIIATVTKMARDITPPSVFLDVINSYFTGQLVDKRMLNNAIKGGK